MTASGCAVLGARSQVTRVQDLRIVHGAVSGSQGDRIVVVAIRHPDGTPADFFELDGDGRYSLLVTPGVFRIAAFRDRNADRVRQLDEPAVPLHAGPTVEISAKVQNFGFDGVLPSEADPTFDLAVDLSDPDVNSRHGLGGPPAGTLATLSDDRFSRANANRGLWRPADFLVDPGGGVFFLEPFDEDRTPVLFVHGMGGTPLDFEFLIGQLDRKRFQAWVMQYPSALRLETVADYLMLSLQDLRDGLGLEQVVVVAHSMGGLVSRAALNDLADTDDSDLVPLFVTISTPWSGHAAAASGVERSPVVLPVWRDMKPGSAFLQTLLVTPLPEWMEFQLFFGFEGSRSFRSRSGANDGVVTLASQLAPEAQQQARRLHGFPANHTEILRRDEVAEALNALLVQSREHW